MNASSHEILKAPAKRLSQILHMGLDQLEPLSPNELRAALEHALDCPLPELLGLTPDAFQRKMQDASFPLTAVCPSFRALIASPQPPLLLLQLLKDHSKHCRRSGNSKLPPEVATAIYYLCVVAARNSLGTSIASLSCEQFNKGVRWLKAQSWISASLQEPPKIPHD